MIAIILFLCDFFMFALLDQWVVSSLLAFFVIKQCVSDSNNFYYMHLPIALLFLQDTLIYGRFGLTALYLLPMLFAAQKGKTLLLYTRTLLPFLLLCCIVLIRSIILKHIILGLNISFCMTIKHICSTLGVGYLVLLGMRSNRLFPLLGGNGRKVWTPNRKDAS